MKRYVFRCEDEEVVRVVGVVVGLWPRCEHVPRVMYRARAGVRSPLHSYLTRGNVFVGCLGAGVCGLGWSGPVAAPSRMKNRGNVRFVLKG